jgi:regulator of protease activity HflC (stomatin/prohibitin superfamily)
MNDQAKVNPRKVVLVLVLLLIGLIVVIRLLTCIRSVGVGQVGIVTSYGQVKGEVSSGLHFIPPWETVTGMSVQNQKVQLDATAATKDLQTVTTTVALNFNLTPKTANDIYKNVGTQYETVVIDPILQETVKSVTAQYNATDLIDQRATVEAQTLTQLNKQLTDRGVTVDNFSIVNFQFSDAYTTAIENKQVEAQNVAAAQYKLQQANLNAQANAVQQAALTPQILEQQAIAKWDGKMPTTVSGGGTIFSIPVGQ